MRIHIFTLFPEMFTGPLDHSIVKRAREAGLVQVELHDIRSYSMDQHRKVDDYPYGGGPGMVMKAEPVFRAVENICPSPTAPVILLSPQGRVFDQREAERLAELNEIFLICGHYEGVDERVKSHLVTDELSIGDYVLTGGELPAMVLLDSVVRLLPGALGNSIGLASDSHSSGMLQFPQYTRPSIFRGWQVPPVLLSGNHGDVDTWRRRQALLRTARLRPEFLEGMDLTSEEQEFLKEKLELGPSTGAD